MRTGKGTPSQDRLGQVKTGHTKTGQVWESKEQAGAELCQAQLPTGILLNCD